MKSKTKISKQALRKQNPELVETIKLAKKNTIWTEVAALLAGPRNSRINLNLDKINELSEDNEKIVISGKVLSQGRIDKKIKIIAFSFSETALDKLKNSGIEVSTIKKEIENNPDAKDIKIIKAQTINN